MKNALFAIFFAVSLHFSLAEDGGKNATTNSTLPATVSNSNVTDPISKPVNSTSAKSSKKLICYYDKASASRSDKLKYSLSNVNASLCTHVVYSYVTLDSVTMKIKNDSLGSDFEDFLTLKERGVIVMVSLGGRADSLESDKYSKMVKDSTLRKEFVDDTVHFLRDRKLQGLDLNWDYPLCWNGYCNAGRPTDKANFQNLVRELHTALGAYKLLLSVSVSPLDSIADKAYDIPSLGKNVDWLNLMTFNYNNFTFNATAIHSPFNGTAPSTVHTVEHYKSKGVPASKLVLGVPTFGRTYTLAKETVNVTGSPSSVGKPTQLNEPGLAAYFEICTGLDYQLVNNVGPYAYKGDQWVSFDDLSSVKAKGEFVNKNKLAGALVYTLDTDDFSGVWCGQGPYPLINALRATIFTSPTNKTE